MSRRLVVGASVVSPAIPEVWVMGINPCLEHVGFVLPLTLLLARASCLSCPPHLVAPCNPGRLSASPCPPPLQHGLRASTLAWRTRALSWTQKRGQMQGRLCARSELAVCTCGCKCSSRYGVEKLLRPHCKETGPGKRSSKGLVQMCTASCMSMCGCNRSSRCGV